MNFLDRFLKNNDTLNFIKILPLGAELSIRTDGQTDRHDKPNSRFSQFCERAYHNDDVK